MPDPAPPPSPTTPRLAPALPPEALARVFEHVSDAVVCFDRAWRYTYLNARAAVMAGRDARTLLGRVAWDEFPGLVGTPVQAAMLEAARTGEAVAHDSLAPTWGRHFTYRFQPFADGVVMIATEHDAPDADDAPLVEQSRYLRAVLDTAPECVKVVARDGTLRDMNPAGLAMLEAPSLAALRGRSVLEIVAAEDRDAYRAMHEAGLRGESGQLQYDVITLGGRRRRFETRSAPLRDADDAVVGVLGVTRDVTDARAAEERLRESEAHFRELTEGAPLGVFVNDAAGATVYVNEHCAHILGAPRESLLGSGWKDAVHPDDAALVMAQRLAFRAGEEDRRRFEYRVRRRDGGARTIVTHVMRLRGVDGQVRSFVGMVEDITERRALEAQLRQAQKMEAVGQLAGGIAHDFNNLLTVIGGSLELARDDLAPVLSPEHPTHADLAEIAQATERARALVRQLLAFSRKQVVTPQAVDVNAVVRGAEQLLQRVVGDEVVLRTRLAPGALVARADAVQLEQVLVNLALNARDAMLTPRFGCAGTGGLLALSTDAVTLDAAAAARPGLAPGEYVRLVARDSGHGMDETTRAHLFEPFFTTKPVGVGTGLGLATVYGIVAQAGGAVQVDSAPGAGATFTILLPRAARVEAAASVHAASRPGPGRGTVLLAEDEPAVRATTRRILERHGYAVLEARHGADALVLWRAHRAEITGLVTDLRMPEMGGRELAARLREEGARLPAVFVSGYSGEAAPSDEPCEGRVLEKPFTADALLGALEAATLAVDATAMGGRALGDDQEQTE